MAESLSASVQEATGRESLTPRTLDYLRTLQGLHEPDVLQINTGMHHGEQVKYVTVRVPEKEAKKWGQLELIQLTDMQFGHRSCKVPRVIEYRDWILKEPNRFVFLTGDCIDAATIFSPGTPWDSLFGPQSQAYRFAEIMAPMRHRILGYVGGNHERRAMPAFGDIGVLLAVLLRIPYSDGQQAVDIYFGEHKPFKTLLWHGTGGARTKGAVAQVLDRFMQKGDSQLFLMGHLHQGLVMPGWRMYRDGKNGLALQKIMGAIGTSFLEYYGSYGEVMGLNPSDVVMARALLDLNGKWELTLR